MGIDTKHIPHIVERDGKHTVLLDGGEYTFSTADDAGLALSLCRQGIKVGRHHMAAALSDLLKE